MKAYPRKERKRPPSHPGVLLREDILPELGLSTTEAAKALGVSRQYMNKILNGEARLSLQMCLKIGKFAGNGAELWVNMQSAYELWHLKQDKDIQKALKSIPEPDDIAA